MKHKPLTLTVITKNGKILLGKKKRGYAEGILNGYGGKVEPGETPEEAMLREFWEESGAKATKYEKVGYIEFTSNIEEYLSECHLYQIHDYEGDIVETEEIYPEWFPVDSIPYHNMWPDDPHWLPLVLEGKKVKGRFLLKDNNVVDSFELVEVEGFEPEIRHETI